MGKGIWITLILGMVLAGPVIAKKPFEEVSEPATPPVVAEGKKEKVLVGQEASRIIEIMIELAWLSDPITFPCFLEARAEGATLQVRGFVPSNSVRDHALRLARLQCSMAVVDHMTIRKGIAVQAIRLPAGQMEKAALACLQGYFPDSDCHFQVQADNGGRVKVTGQVHSFEEKLAVSQELRRLHGCSVVVNQVHVVAENQPRLAPSLNRNPKPDMEADSALVRVKPEKPEKIKPPPLVVKVPEAESKSLLGKFSWTKPAIPLPFAKSQPPEAHLPSRSPEVKKPAAHIEDSHVKTASADEEGPNLSPPPLVTHGTVLVVEDNTPASPEIALRKQITASCGIPEQYLQIHLKNATDLEIRLQAGNQDEANALAQRIFQLQELFPYQVDLQVIIPK
jgi:BON domain-containing protein